MNHYLTPSSDCPECGYTSNAVGRPGDDHGGPQEGDLCICGGCLELLQFDGNLSVRVAPPEVVAELDADYLAQIQAGREYIQSMRSRQAKRAVS